MAATFKLADAVLFDGGLQPWRELSLPWTSGQPVPSMMSPDELAFLHYLARIQYRGEGAIVDLGPLAGGSAYALASGMGASAFRVHSFDYWRSWADCGQWFPGLDLQPGDDLLPAFLDNLGPYKERIVPYQGDILSQSWCGEPVEIIFIDAAKSPMLMLHIIREFYPRLVQGGWLVHQDYVSSRCPWIHIAERELRDYFEVYDSPFGGTVCFRLIRKFPRDAVPGVDYFARLPLDRARQLLRDAELLFSVCWERLCVRLAAAHYLLMAGQFIEAKETFDQVISDPLIECNGVQNDVRMICSKIAGCLI